LALPAMHCTSIYRITTLPILHFIPRAKNVYKLLCTVPFAR